MARVINVLSHGMRRTRERAQGSVNIVTTSDNKWRPVETDELTQKVKIAKLLVQNSHVPVVASLVVACLMIWALRDNEPTLDLSVWAAALLVVNGVRFALFHNPKSYSHIWKFSFLPLFAALTFASGLIWGVAAVIFFDPEQIQFQALLAFCLGGLVAGSLVSYVSWPLAFFAFAVPTLAPLITRLIAQADEVHVIMGVMLILFGGALAVLARNINRSLTQSLALQSALGNSEGRFRGVFESSPAGMLLMELDGRIMMANRAFGVLLGYTPEELSGQNWREISHPDDIETTVKLDVQVIAGAMPDLLVEKRYLHKDGHVIWTDVATCLIGNPNLGNAYLLGQIFDITALKSVERMKNEFVSTVSHELRTPLTSIEGSLGLILGGATGELSEATREMTTLASKNSRRLITLVNDLLDLDRLESNNLAFSFHQLELNDLVEEMIEHNRGLADSVGISIDYRPIEQNARVLGDQGRLEQVLTNLISNAVKFSPQGGRVAIAVTREGPSVRVTVTDQGPGVPDDFRQSIFNRFSQADASDTRAKGGAGLGLNISKSIMEKHAGELNYQSSAGKGASFYFELREWTGTESFDEAVEKLRSSGLRPGR